ncbi:MAG TPA: DCC1-like thiol-disulfide oxidoreductase family protein [Bacteriovoracaceae bacterium]|nr:DCC1-like thiol-disulfide oxidoreductase family protein [Bacteriovoracaceae bacterium]
MDYQLPLILYDPECPLCLRFKQGLQYLDKSMNYVSAREDQVYALFPELNRQDCLEKVHLVTPERKILAGPEVVDYLIESLPGISKLSWLLDNDQGRKVKEFFYQKVEELRELSHKKEDCNQCPRK